MDLLLVGPFYLHDPLLFQRIRLLLPRGNVGRRTELFAEGDDGVEGLDGEVDAIVDVAQVG